MNTRHFKFWPKRLPKELYYPQVPLFSIAETSANYYPEKTAIDYYGKEITYAELQRDIISLATALKQMGVEKAIGSRCIFKIPRIFVSVFLE